MLARTVVTFTPIPKVKVPCQRLASWTGCGVKKRRGTNLAEQKDVVLVRCIGFQAGKGVLS